MALCPHGQKRLVVSASQCPLSNITKLKKKRKKLAATLKLAKSGEFPCFFSHNLVSWRKKRKKEKRSKIHKENPEFVWALYTVKEQEICVGIHNYTAVKNLFVRCVNLTPKFSPQLSVGRRLKPPVVRTPANRKTNASRETQRDKRERGRRMSRWVRMMIRKKLE